MPLSGRGTIAYFQPSVRILERDEEVDVPFSFLPLKIIRLGLRDRRLFPQVVHRAKPLLERLVRFLEYFDVGVLFLICIQLASQLGVLLLECLEMGNLSCSYRE